MPPKAPKEEVKNGHDTVKADEKDEFRQVASNRLIFKADALFEQGIKDALVEGYVLDRREMPGERVWFAYVIKLTRATKATDRDGNVHDVEPGDEIYVPETYQLSQELSKYIGHPSKVVKVRIKPLKKIPIGKGKTMWTFELGIGSVYPRADHGAPVLPQFAEGD